MSGQYEQIYHKKIFESKWDELKFRSEVMISAKHTEKLVGLTIEGDYDDFYEIVESIYRMTGPDDSYSDYYWGVKNRLLGVCYDIRHAYMGDRDIKLVDNGVQDEMMKWHSMILPKQEVHFSVNIMFPEAVFVALSAPELYVWSSQYYGQRTKKQEEVASFPAQKYSDYVRDKAIIDTLSAVILGALAEVIGDDELEKLFKLKGSQYGDSFFNYATQYVDKCNIEYLKTASEKRKDKLRNIAKRFVKQPDSYRNMKRDLEYAARHYGCSIYELHDPKLEYPEEIEW